MRFFHNTTGSNRPDLKKDQALNQYSGAHIDDRRP